MMHRQKRRRLKTILAISVVGVLALAVGIWLLLHNGGNQLQATYSPTTSAPVDSTTPTQTPSESALGVSMAEATPLSTIDRSDWRLLLVNAQHSLDDGFEVKLTELSNGHAIDDRCYPDLQKMMDDCRAAGLEPLICSSYRSQEKQQELFDNKVQKLTQQGLSEDEARERAATIVALPGTSEHQTGLAVDIVDINNQNLDESQESTPVQQWLVNNCWHYGFILRYPKDKIDITGIMYESWHYRYVGKEAAQAIKEQGLCLEEFLNQLE